jgi:hypothetical protein
MDFGSLFNVLIDALRFVFSVLVGAGILGGLFWWFTGFIDWYDARFSDDEDDDIDNHDDDSHIHTGNGGCYRV